MKKDRQIHSHQHQGALRPEEAMSVYYRAHEGSQASGAGTLSLYEPKQNAGQSIHGQIGWKSILSTNDDLAISDPKMAEKVTELSRLESQQSAWTGQQKQSFEYQNDRYEHMWHVIKQEILKEHDREKRLLTMDVHANQKETEIGIWKERIDAVDRLVETLRCYGYLRGTNEADYILKGIEKWKAELAKSRRTQQVGGGERMKKGKRKNNLRKKEEGRKGSSLMMRSLAGIRSNEVEGEDTDEDSDNESTEAGGRGRKDIDDESSIHSLRKITSAAKTSHLLASSSQGGYLGLGLLSTLGATEATGPRESSTGLSSQILMKGPMGLVGNSECDPSSASTVARPSSLRLKASTVGGSTIMARKRLEEKQMQLLASRYT